MHKIVIEIFKAKIQDDKVLYTKHLVEVGNSEERDPDEIVQEEIQKHMLTEHIERAITHSTSWRYEKELLTDGYTGTIVLTYLVYSDFLEFSRNPNFPTQELRLQDMEIAVGKSHKAPRPKLIEEKHVLSHAIRHLAFLYLSNDNDHFNHILSESSKTTLIKCKPATALRLHMPNE